MAFIEGQITPAEKRALERLGHKLETAPDDMVRIYVDSDVVDIVTGGAWDVESTLDVEKLQEGDEVLWIDPDAGVATRGMFFVAFNEDDETCRVRDEDGRQMVVFRDELK